MSILLQFAEHAGRPGDGHDRAEYAAEPPQQGILGELLGGAGGPAKGLAAF